MPRPKATPFLWFEKDAEKAAELYVSLIPNSSVTGSQFGPDGSVFVVSFTLDGVPYTALNGGPHYKLSCAFSISVTCDDQEEVDRLWAALGEGGEEKPCGWLTDRFGLSWQIMPRAYFELMGRGSGEQSGRVQTAAMAMKKIDIAVLQHAFDGNTA